MIIYDYFDKDHFSKSITPTSVIIITFLGKNSGKN